MTAEDRLLTADEVADLYRVERNTVYSWRSRGTGPRSFKIGRRVVYEAAAVAEWLAAQKDATSRGGAA